MKKFLIGVIFIIPIVVVVALSATGAIIGMTTPVNPESIVLKDSNNVEIDRNAIVKIDSKNFDEFIIIDVMPSITQNKAVTFERVEEAGDGEVLLEQIGESNRYAVTPVKIGVTKFIIRAKANVNVFKEITFYVSSDSVETISIYGDDGLICGDNLDVSESTRLFVDVYPIDAVSDNSIEWSVLPSGVVDVTQNGNVSVLSHGIARITVKARDKDGNVVSDFIDVDTTNAVITSSNVYVEEEVDVDWIAENVVLQDGAVVVANGGGVFTVTHGGRDYVVTTAIVESGTWGIEALPNTMYTRNGAYDLTIKDLLTNESLEGFEVELTNEEALSYDAELGFLIPLAPGTCIVKVEYDGVTQEQEVTIRDNPIAFELEFGTADEKLGIQMTRKWGNYWLTEDNELVREFRFGLNNKDNTFDVVWSVSNPDAVEIVNVENSQDIILKFNEKAEGESITVTARLKINNYLLERVKRSFTFNMLEEANSVNVYSFEQAIWVENYKFTHMVIQNDIVATRRLKRFTASLYGNGFSWDATGIPMGGEYGLAADKGALEYDYEWFIEDVRNPAYKDKYELFLAEFDEGSRHQNVTEIPEGASFIDVEINFEDLVIYNSEKIEDAKNRGCGIKIYGLWDETRSQFNNYPFDVPVNCRFIQAYNGHRGIELGCPYNVLIEGCILGDVYETCVFGYYLNDNQRRFEESVDITLRNNVFKISDGPSMLFSNVASDLRTASSTVNYAPHLTFSGTNDFYNWKTKEEFGESLVNLINSYVGMAIGDNAALASAIDSLLRPALSKVIKEVINSEVITPLYYDYAGEKYVSFGMLGLGALFYFNTDKVDIETQKLILMDLPFKDAEGNPVGRSLQSLETFLSLNNTKIGLDGLTTLCNPSAMVCTNFAGGDPDIQPGDPIPNSVELYQKLRGEAK